MAKYVEVTVKLRDDKYLNVLTSLRVVSVDDLHSMTEPNTYMDYMFREQFAQIMQADASST